MIAVYFSKSDMASACVCTLRIVLADKILHPTNTIITINLYIYMCTCFVCYFDSLSRILVPGHATRAVCSLTCV